MAQYIGKTISNVICEMVNHTTFLPAIQREYVWTPYQIEKLFDSLMCDYPINTFLFWRIREEDKKKWTSYEFLRNYDYRNPHNDYANLDGVNNDIYLVLDGQQRLTSLNIALRGSFTYFYRKPRKTYLYLNLLHTSPNDNPEELTYQFLFREDDVPSPKMNEPQLWYKVGEILNYEDAESAKEAYEPYLNGLTDEKKKIARRLIGLLHHHIKTKEVISFYEEKSDNYDKVMEIFVRTNTGGQKLEYSDILLSTATAKWKHLNAREEINNFTDEINAIGDYHFGKDFVMKGAMYLTNDLPIQYKLSSFTQTNLETIEEHWEETKMAIRDAVYLVHKFGFTDKNLVTKLALLPIAQYLRNKNSSKYISSTIQSDVVDQNNIQKWLIIITLRNLLSASTDTTLTRLRKLIGNTKDTFPYQSIMHDFGIKGFFTDDEIENFLSYKHGSRHSYLILSLLYQGRDWKDRTFQEDHIFPYSKIQRKELKKLGYDDDKITRYITLRDTICNLELLDGPENNAKNNQDFGEWITTRDANFRQRHHIPDMASYTMDDFESFIAKRRIRLTNILQELNLDN